MQIIVIGANRTIGSSVRKLYEKGGVFDAVVNASGDVAFAPLIDLTS